MAKKAVKKTKKKTVTEPTIGRDGRRKAEGYPAHMGQGRPKGSKNKATLRKERMEALLMALPQIGQAIAEYAEEGNNEPYKGLLKWMNEEKANAAVVMKEYVQTLLMKQVPQTMDEDVMALKLEEIKALAKESQAGSGQNQILIMNSPEGLPHPSEILPLPKLPAEPGSEVIDVQAEEVKPKDDDWTDEL